MQLALKTLVVMGLRRPPLSIFKFRNGKVKEKRGARFELGFKIDVAPVLLYDGLGNAEAKTRPSSLTRVRRVGLSEFLENSVMELTGRRSKS